MLDFLLYYPIGHGVNIEPDDIAPDPVGFQERRAPPMKGSAMSGPESCLDRKRPPEGLAENSDKSSPRNKVPGLRANHL